MLLLFVFIPLLHAASVPSSSSYTTETMEDVEVVVVAVPHVPLNVTVKNCTDFHSLCETWALEDQCETNAIFMLRYCKFSCGICSALSLLDHPCGFFNAPVMPDVDPEEGLEFIGALSDGGALGLSAPGSGPQGPGFMTRQMMYETVETHVEEPYQAMQPETVGYQPFHEPEPEYHAHKIPAKPSYETQNTAGYMTYADGSAAPYAMTSHRKQPQHMQILHYPAEATGSSMPYIPSPYRSNRARRLKRQNSEDEDEDELPIDDISFLPDGSCVVQTNMHAIFGGAIAQIDGMTIEECEAACVDNEDCQAALYYTVNEQCLLYDIDVMTADGQGKVLTEPDEDVVLISLRDAENCPQLTGECACSNTHSYCGYWAADGECTKNPLFMILTCRKACLVCDP